MKASTSQVKVPAGVDTGSRLRLSGMGEAGTGGGPTGDLIIVIHVADHDIFDRDGDAVQRANWLIVGEDQVCRLGFLSGAFKYCLYNGI